MGLPVEPPCCGAGAASSSGPPACHPRTCGVGEEAAAGIGIGCRTPPRRAAGHGDVAAGGCGCGDGEARSLVCPPAPRKKRRPAPAATVAPPRATEFYNGADLEAFFAAHNL